MRFIGDIHGKYKRYTAIVKECDASIQVGDFGMGFSPKHPWDYKTDKSFYSNHRFIRGNHDSPSHCARTPWWIPDGTVEDSMMFIGGALSIDAASRQEGVSWWRDEELSIEAFNRLIDKYEQIKPDIMVSHEAPEYIIKDTMSWYGKMELPSRTRQALQTMWEIHSPKLWVFGHWHSSVDRVINGCRFRCLNELEYEDIDLAQYRS